MAESVLGQVVWAAEASAGEQALMAFTAVAGTMSLTAAPAGSSGQRLHVKVINNTVVGTITITGKDINGNAQSETIPPTGSIPVPPATAQNPYVGAYDYVSMLVYGSGTTLASAIATTGLTNGSIYIGGVQAGKYLIPCDFDFDLHYDEYSPDEFRGSFDKDFELLQMRRLATIDKFDQDCYPETSLLYWHMMVSASPTVTTLPSSATSLLAATAVASLTNVTTQPTTPGMKLRLAVASSSAVGTLTIVGTTPTGQALTESVQCNGNGTNGNGTYYSANVFLTITSVTPAGLTSGMVSMDGVFGFKWVFTPANSTPQTGAFEFFTGTDSGIFPYCALEEMSLEYAPDKVAHLTGKGIAQDFLPIGDRTTLNLGTNRITSLGQPVDNPWVGTRSQVWIDNASTGTSGTTLYNDLLTNKIDFKWPVAGKWTSMLPGEVFNRIRRKKRETTCSITIDFTNELQAEAFRKAQRQFFQFQLIGRNIGGGNQKSITVLAAAKIETFKRKPGIEADTVEADVMLRFLYDSTIGASYTITVINQQAPTYTS